MYVYPITRQHFEYANGTPCENNPQKFVACDPAADQNYVSPAQHIEQDAPQLFERLDNYYILVIRKPCDLKVPVQS